MEKLNFTDTLKTAATDVAGNLPLFAVVMTVMMLPNIIFAAVSAPTAVMFLTNTIYGACLQGGLYSIFLAVANGQSATVSDLFSGLTLFWRFLIAHLLFFAIVFAGLLLLIVPGIIWAVQFALYLLPIAEEHAGPVEALKRSHQLSKGHWWPLLWLYLLMFAIIFSVGILAGVLSVPLGSILPRTLAATVVPITTTVLTALLTPYLGMACARVYLRLKGATTTEIS